MKGRVVVNTKLTTQEKLKDLRVERHLTLEQLAQESGISKSALGKYESDDFKDISPFSIVTLAKFYIVNEIVDNKEAFSGSCWMSKEMGDSTKLVFGPVWDFGSSFATWKAGCHTIAYNILHNNEDAEECSNDTYLGAWNSIPPQRPNRLSIYLGKITRNLALNRYKRYTAEKRGHGQVELVLSELEACIPANTSVEQAIEEKELAAAIDRFLYSRPEQNRRIFVRRYWHLYAIRDIADAYGMSESKVTSLLFRMRNELRIFLEKEGIML